MTRGCSVIMLAPVLDCATVATRAWGGEPIMLAGPARVIDGDTIDIAGARIRLHGIDAPEIR
jgi:endonuclease YncB( thermonuclease family)